MVSETERQSILEEYKALRAEIITLVQARNQFLLYDLAAFGALFAAAIQFGKAYFLVAPLVHFPLMAYWAYADTHILRIGWYIKEEIEPKVGGMRWEQKMFATRFTQWKEPIWSRLTKHISKWNLQRLYRSELSALVVFAGSTVLALLIWLALWSTDVSTKAGLTEFGPHLSIALFVADLFVIVYAFRLIYTVPSEFEEPHEVYRYNRAEEKNQQEYQQKLEKYEGRFPCSEPKCDIFSAGPLEKSERMVAGASSEIINVYLDIPKDFKRCSDCGQWVCRKHYIDQLFLCHSDAKRRGLNNFIELNGAA